MSRPPPQPSASARHDLMVRFARRQLRGLTAMVRPHYGPLGDFPQDLHAVGRFEPRIECLARQIKLLWTHLPAELLPHPSPPTSFFPKRLADWLVSLETMPEARSAYTSVLQYLSSPCGADCEFCLHKNDPPGHWTKGGRWRRSPAEVQARLRCYEPDKGTALFRTQDYAFFEITTHPDFLSTLRQVRRKTHDLIAFTTNGTALTAERVRELAPLRPLHLMVSLNTTDAATRAALMHETDPHVGIECLEHLRGAGISFSVSILPYGEAHLDGLGETMRYAEACGAYLIRINLPGYSRHFPRPPRSREATRGFWRRIVERVEAERPGLESPVVFQPSHADPQAAARHGVRAAVAGAVPNSPAGQAGLRHGDTIVRIDDTPIRHRTEAARLLQMYRMLRIDRVTLFAEREGRTLSVELHEEFAGPLDASRYPHFSHLSESAEAHDITFPYGIVLQPTFDPDLLASVRQTISRHAAHRVLLLSSELLEPLVAALIAETRCFEGLDAEVRLAAPRNEHFLGGDLAPGDLLVADDFVACIRRQPARPDLVLVPSTPFGPWGRDISNKPYLEIERATGIPVAVIPCGLISAI